MNPLTLQTDRALIRSSSRSTRYVLATIEAPVAPQAKERAPLDVAFVIDRSGSMGGEKIVLARDAVLEGIGMLRDTDRFTVVSFDSHIDVVVPPTAATHDARRDAEARVQSIEARANTNLSEGWLTGCRQLAASKRPDAVARCLLLSDGHANDGITEQGALQRLAADWLRQGIVTTTLGVGANFDEQLMSAMAQAGGGHGYFIRENRQTGDLLTNIIGEALEVVASGVTLVTELPAGMEAEVLGAFASEPSANTLRVTVGQLVSGQELPIVLRVTCPTGPEGQHVVLTARIEDRDGVLGGATARVTWTWASHAANDQQPRERAVDVAVARQYAAKARNDALQCNREGRFDEARRALDRVRRRIERYAGDCRELRELVQQLRREMDEFGGHMTAMQQKMQHYGTMAAMQSRSMSGKARRSRYDMELFPVTLVGGVPVFICQGRQVVLDTGSPVSFGRGPLQVLGQVHDLPPQFGPFTIDDIGRALNGPIDALVGGDILSGCQWLLDTQGGRLLAVRGELACDGITLRTPTVAGVPTASVAFDGRDGRAVLATGARISYADAAFLALGQSHGLGQSQVRQPVGRMRDFHPMLGAFETDVFELPAAIAGQRFTARVGVLPPGLQQAIALTGAHWIVGMDVLGQFPFVLDAGHGRMKIVVGDLEELLAVV
jgi:Ca-activated chloride channel family protein